MEHIQVTNTLYRTASYCEYGFAIYRFLQGGRNNLPPEIINILPPETESICIKPNDSINYMNSFGKIWIVYYQGSFYKMSISNNNDTGTYEINYLSKMNEYSMTLSLMRESDYSEEVINYLTSYFDLNIN